MIIFGIILWSLKETVFVHIGRLLNAFKCTNPTYILIHRRIANHFADSFLVSDELILIPVPVLDLLNLRRLCILVRANFLSFISYLFR